MKMYGMKKAELNTHKEKNMSENTEPKVINLVPVGTTLLVKASLELQKAVAEDLASEDKPLRDILK